MLCVVCCLLDEVLRRVVYCLLLGVCWLVRLFVVRCLSFVVCCVVFSLQLVVCCVLCVVCCVLFVNVVLSAGC